MKLIVGLGNPGEKYKNTRHNIGFKILENFKTKYQISNVKYQKFILNKRFNADVMEIEYQDEKVLFIKPHTFMNNSGEAVAKMANFYKISPKDILVICDDLNLEIGQIRIRKSGSDGGHNGLKSIISCLGDNQFSRMRVGIGTNLDKNIPAENYVLQKFSTEENRNMDKAIDKTGDLVVKFIIHGLDEETITI